MGVVSKRDSSEPLLGRDFFAAAQAVNESQAKITMRWRHGIKASDRIVRLGELEHRQHPERRVPQPRATDLDQAKPYRGQIDHVGGVDRAAWAALEPDHRQRAELAEDVGTAPTMQ
ncbi:phage head completion protein [Stenotrophomonas sp. CFBP8980]|uniref:phage head completion protein n=1 Tax=Stenotrophomonas sp. CFBP8980 TaxID=3096523 RepID=UPI002A6B0C92|nr:head-tail adaptor protein [Stenotrophomonas sp. CFBP8980]MDY1033393.1 head-tail adaptor protein [Stenotrophomonas sp. CFBP8980]